MVLRRWDLCSNKLPELPESILVFMRNNDGYLLAKRYPQVNSLLWLLLLRVLFRFMSKSLLRGNWGLKWLIWEQWLANGWQRTKLITQKWTVYGPKDSLIIDPEMYPKSLKFLLIIENPSILSYAVYLILSIYKIFSDPTGTSSHSKCNWGRQWFGIIGAKWNGKDDHDGNGETKQFNVGND